MSSRGGWPTNLGIDYAELAAKRILQLMNAREVAEVATNGVDVQLHTHRHRTPEDGKLSGGKSPRTGKEFKP